MSDVDPAIARIEAELRESRFKPWDVETFLANRHQAKIDALTEPSEGWRRYWVSFCEMYDAVALYFGRLFVIVALGLSLSWMIYG